MIRFKQFLIEQELTPKKLKTAKEIATEFITLPDVEGYRENAYQDTGGIWTVGPGITRYSTGMEVGEGDIIPLKYGMKELHYHIDNKVIPNLSKKIPNWDKMSENQKAALISFSYNAGENFYNAKGFETITNALSDQANWNKVPDALKLYNKGKNIKTGQKEVLPGLVKRRANEGSIWSGTYQGSKSNEPVQTIEPTKNTLTDTLEIAADVVRKPLEAMGTVLGGITPIPKSRTSPTQETTYVVKSGDTLSKIAGGDQKAIDAIAAANAIKDLNKIYPGQKLKIPSR